MFNWLKSTFTKNNYIYEPQPLMPRTVNTTGVNFHFAMPENFSLDMPGDDLIENVDLNKHDISGNSSIQLIKRWWDFYCGPPSVKNTIGTLMLSLDIYPRNKHITGSLFDYDTMVNAVYHDILKEFSVTSAEETPVMGEILPNAATDLDEFSNNGRNWVIVGIGYPDNTSNALNIYSTPISDDWYLRARFMHSTGGGKNSGPFLRRSLGEQMRILESCELDFITAEPAIRPPIEHKLSLGPLTKEEQEISDEQNKKYFGY
jgi:hypothetical protein